MVAITSVVRKPPATQVVAGRRIQLRLMVAAAAGMLAAAPVAAAVGTLLAWNLAVVVVVAGGALGIGAVNWRPEGLSLPAYLAGAVRARRNRLQIDGQPPCQLHVGLAPVQDRHLGQRFRYARRAVEVDPDRVDARGSFRPSTGRR